ncbi:Eco57I restriction-modification methylase domain-containing protein [Cellulomonas dongxiuzhuiae]|uniref:Eco57I restriction-modification methylase domain-containing protein n=1 Tax=Cellulomonas dongxiuzhuiae TaxID=2819979 RepID=UPI001FB867C0|nr:DNA methyltransferase [Cellulomonas dongxiuzhuiae]
MTRDRDLIKRLRPYIGVIRRDLRNRPTVIQAGGLVVVETPSRATSGAHYTPKSLAREVVLHALEPLVYRPGPHQTPDREQWRLLSSDQILDLKVADIACGSGAFLVAAAEYLGERLLEAWHHERVAHGKAHDMKTRAVRQVVASCLYGADINGMAVEMCKLSLWLVSLDPKLPFSFVDDKVLHGNSLLGLTDVKQLEALHIRPAQAMADELFAFNSHGAWAERLDLDAVMTRAVSLRQCLASEIDNDDPQRSAASKRRQWAEYQRLTAQLATVADGVVAAGLALGGKNGRALNEAYENLRVAVGRAFPFQGAGDSTMLHRIIKRGLTPAVPTDYAQWKPLHWVLAVPDVMAHGGFDAIIGNPPFISATDAPRAMGSNMHDWIAHEVGDGRKGKADIVAFFFLRALGLCRQDGTIGMLATNTLGQGDTREVGLDSMVRQGFEITRSVRSAPWGRRVSVEYAAVWGTCAHVNASSLRISDGRQVTRISTLLEPSGRSDAAPRRLRENSGRSFNGMKIYGTGFIVSPDDAAAWIDTNPRNAEVLFPCLNSDDLNSSPTLEASSWAIDFNDRTLDQAESYHEPFQRILLTVKPDRDRVSRKAIRERWWQYGDRRPALRRAVGSLQQVLVIGAVSKHGMVGRVRRGQVLNHRLTVIASDSPALQAILSSSIHLTWAIARGATLETRVCYNPSDVFETFPFPPETTRLEELGWRLESTRRELMRERNLGITNLYNLVNTPGDTGAAHLRDIHAELDEAVMAAYGWDDLPLDHGFHTYRQMERWTVGPAARVEILDRLLEENHRRAAQQGAVVLAPDEGEDSE